jgi:hypothetical protein
MNKIMNMNMKTEYPIWGQSDIRIDLNIHMVSRPISEYERDQQSVKFAPISDQHAENDGCRISVTSF